MTETWTGHWLALVRSHGAATVFLGVFVESVILPIPSPPFIMGAAAVLVAPGLGWREAFLPLLSLVALPGAAGTALGALVIFGLAYAGGKPLIDRFGGLVGIDWEGVMRMESRLSERVDAAIFVTRALPIFPLGLISAAAGVLRVPLANFTLWTFAGALVRCLLLGYMGFLTRSTYQAAAGKLSALQAALSAAALAAGAVFLYWLRRRAKKPAP